MRIEQTSITATKALLANKGRSLLTILGVVIGVFSVVMMISLGQGIENYVTDEFEAIGSNLLFVAPGDTDVGGDPNTAFTKNKLDEKHIDLINLYAADSFVSTSPYYLVGQTAKYKTNSYFSEIVGVNAESLEYLNYPIDEGRNFIPSEVSTRSKVAIIGPLIKDELFGNQSPLSRSIHIGGETFNVIGVFKEKGTNYDDQILVPYTSAREAFDLDKFSSIVMQVKPDENIDIAVRKTELALLRDLKSDDFTVLSQQDLLDSIQEILGTLTLGLGIIAGISLVVGGIGIMNIMLVSVTERIREIGLRKSLGATKTDIALQFLIESIILSVVGGGVGLVFGALGTLAAQPYLRAEIPTSAVILAFGFSFAVGVIFGTYPALDASKKSPIESLRYE